MEEFTDIFIEVLEVFINTILYSRTVYSKKIFKKRKIYNSPVFISIYPPLNDYIQNVLQSARELKASGELYKVEVILYRDEKKTYENYVFEVDDKNKIFYDSDSDKYLLKFEEEVRKSLLQFSERIAKFRRMPNDVKFKVHLHTTQSAFMKMSNKPALQDFPWLQESQSKDCNKSKVSILPLTAAQGMGLQIYAEYHTYFLSNKF